MELTIMNSNHRIVARMPMRHYPTENAIAYNNTLTGSAVYFHLNGELWSVNRFSYYRLKERTSGSKNNYKFAFLVFN